MPPERELISLSLTPEQVKVIILDNGESKYGLAFHQPASHRRLSNSLRNIFAALSEDLGLQFRRPRRGDLRSWHSKGIFLYVNDERRGRLNYEVMRRLSTCKHPIVWMLWGKRAQEFSALVPKHHLLLCADYPSSPRSKFLPNSNHFSQCAKFLNEDPIKFWSL